MGIADHVLPLGDLLKLVCFKAKKKKGRNEVSKEEKEEWKKNRSPNGNMWTAIPVALLCMVVNRNERQGSGPKGDEVL